MLGVVRASQASHVWLAWLAWLARSARMPRTFGSFGFLASLSSVNVIADNVRLVLVSSANILTPRSEIQRLKPASLYWQAFLGGGGGGDSHMKQTGMLVVSLRGVKFWILVSLRLFRTKRQYFKPPRSRLGFREETQNYAKRNRSQIFI